MRIKKELLKRGTDKVIIICDAHLRHDIDDKQGYERLKNAGQLYETPARREADAFFLDYAKRKNAHVISNDKFLEYYDIFGEEWIKEKRIKFSFIDDELILDPKLDEIL